VIAVFTAPNGYVALFILLLNGPLSRLLNRVMLRREGGSDAEAPPVG
jgi:hypothetical protein